MTALATPRTDPIASGVAVDSRRARLDAGVRLGTLVGLWAALLLVSYWWASGGGIQDLAGWVTGLTSTGRLTGLLASVLLLAQVLLMARLPLVEHAFGQERLARLHRFVGFTSFNLMLAHIALITYGYAAGRLTATPGTLWDLTVDDPGMLLAAAGTLCLIMVVVTSVKAARRRLRYESWHLLHLYAYLGVGLALPHQLWTGRDFIGSTARIVFWWTLWAASFGAVLIWRLGLPLWRSARYRLRVVSVVPEAADVLSVYLAGRGIARLNVEAGQFFSFRFLNGRGWSRAHPYSLSAAPDGRHLRITAKSVGDGSRALAMLRPNTRVLIEGPYGRLSARTRTRRRMAFIGAGVGITPLRALAEALPYNNHDDAVLLYRYSRQMLFEAEFRALSEQRGLRVLLLPGHRRAADSWLTDAAGNVDDLTALKFWIPDVADRDVYVCGPQAWADDVRRTTEAAGLSADHFHVERFGW
ncbi:MAG: ferric reductase-like transmembrane domain-containing protein [Actinomycetota bacterium]|nr:ferric reductase-like transmembrane domain-containing protein [Actinomycetota bacterium]